MDESTIEDDIIESYVDDFQDHLDNLENDILSLEDESAAIDSVFRVIHSIKGSAAMLGFKELGKLAHSMENLLSLIRNGKCSAEGAIVDTLLEGTDFLKQSFADLKNCNKIDFSKLHQKIDQILAGIDGEAVKKIDPVHPPIHQEDYTVQADTTKRILIVEDELVNQRFLEKSIENIEGSFEVVVVDSAALGMYYFFTEDFDLIFLDIMMPNIDGNTFIAVVEENLQKGLLKKKPKIIVQTAIQSIDSLSILAQNECVQEILRKPVKVENVVSAVYRYCYEK